jgi:MYXO-CTERM domain-containing protein
MAMQRPLLLALLVAVLSAGPASATSVSFECLSNSSKCAVGEAQLSVDVTAAGPGQVSFRLRNLGSESLTASQVFFDDDTGLLLGDLVSVLAGSGVEFEEGGKPDNLKGGNKIGFDASAFASATKPAKENGVNPGEELVLIFELAGTHTFEDVIAALESESLRIGINAKKAYVTTATSMPEPGALSLLALAGAAAWIARRRS